MTLNFTNYYLQFKSVNQMKLSMKITNGKKKNSWNYRAKQKYLIMKIKGNNSWSR